MPTLKQLTCAIESGASQTPLKEYATTYSDGFVQTHVATPSATTTFSIHLTSKGYIAPGLAVFVYMDGLYQCNRNRHGLKMPAEAKKMNETEVNIRLRQKEERTEDGLWLGKEWRFERLNIVSGDEACLPHPPPGNLDHIGKIEVVVLRCQANSKSVEKSAAPEPQPSATTKQVPKSGPTTSSKPSTKHMKVAPLNYPLMGGLFDGTCERILGTFSKPTFGLDGHWDAEDTQHFRDSNQKWGVSMTGLSTGRYRPINNGSSSSSPNNERFPSVSNSKPPRNDAGETQGQNWDRSGHRGRSGRRSVSSQSRAASSGSARNPSAIPGSPRLDSERGTNFQGPNPAAPNVTINIGPGGYSSTPAQGGNQSLGSWEDRSHGSRGGPSPKFYDRSASPAETSVSQRIGVEQILNGEMDSAWKESMSWGGGGGDSEGNKDASGGKKTRSLNSSRGRSKAPGWDSSWDNVPNNCDSRSTRSGTKTKEWTQTETPRQDGDHWQSKDKHIQAVSHRIWGTGGASGNDYHRDTGQSSRDGGGWGGTGSGWAGDTRDRSSSGAKRLDHDDAPTTWQSQPKDDWQAQGKETTRSNSENIHHEWAADKNSGSGPNQMDTSSCHQMSWPCTQNDMNEGHQWGSTRNDDERGGDHEAKNQSVDHGWYNHRADNASSHSVHIQPNQPGQETVSNSNAGSSHDWTGSATLVEESPRAVPPFALDFSSVQPYWSTCQRPEGKEETAISTNMKRSEGVFFTRGEDPLYTIPQTSVDKSHASHQVQPGQPAKYYHKLHRPDYMDTMESPYAVFVFRYRSKDILEKLLDLKIPDDTEDEKLRLQGLPKEQIIEEYMKSKVDEHLVVLSIFLLIIIDRTRLPERNITSHLSHRPEFKIISQTSEGFRVLYRIVGLVACEIGTAKAAAFATGLVLRKKALSRTVYRSQVGEPLQMSMSGRTLRAHGIVRLKTVQGEAKRRRAIAGIDPIRRRLGDMTGCIFKQR
ncbi:MAG: hypothetical protein M1837_006519 [Sclerophora amabilis]|nr:MAG: hypothetical protein M1837_006519 [Sclerophora amabilis]